MNRISVGMATLVFAMPILGVPLLAQAQSPPAPAEHQHEPMTEGGAEAAEGSWHLMQDGVVFLNVNHQGGPRGGTELAPQSWWMGMAQRPAAGGTLQFNLMLSLDPATLGADGYRELFQVGETLNHLPLVDRQHPHDLLMQAAVVWRVPLSRGYALTLAGAPVGEPALGPVAFMHRASAFDNPTAPLGHHTFDSTHISMGVLTAGVDRGPWAVEGSVFRGAEPDEQRWDLMDPGALDSWSVRGWYRPSERWAFQLSHGFLTNPEATDPGNLRRTTASASWIAHRPRGWTAATVAYGRNNEPGRDFNAWLAEGTHVVGETSVYGRVERVDRETDVLRFGIHAFVGGSKAHVPEGVGGVNAIGALTIGAVRTVGRRRGWDLAAGADVTAYAFPTILKPLYSDRPVSLHVFVRLRPPAPMGRMMDGTMTRIGGMGGM
jgi:hypothetical protein